MSSQLSPLNHERRVQIRDQACRLFREKGYHATSVRDIAEAVGLQGGSLYAHVDSKDELLWQIVNHSADRFFAVMKPIAESDRAIAQKLRQAIIAHVGVITENLDAAAVYSHEWRHLPDEKRRQFALRRDEYENLFRSMIRDGIHSRILATDDEAFASLFILSALNWIQKWYRPDGRLSPEALGRRMADFIFDGLLRRSA